MLVLIKLAIPGAPFSLGEVTAPTGVCGAEPLSFVDAVFWTLGLAFSME